MRPIRLSLLALALTFASGCGFHYGFVRDASTVHSLRYDMSHGFQFARTVNASSSGGTLLCLFPVGDATYAEAMAKLFEAAKLGPNEALVNLREDHATRIYLLYCSSELTVSGDVVIVGKPPK